MTTHFLRHGHTPEARQEVLEALAQIAGTELSAWPAKEQRQEAITHFAERVAVATEERFLLRQRVLKS
jgi:hypothetical protein